jgi:hypothetical protein
MLKSLKRWLGWDADASLFDFGALGERRDATPPQAPRVATPPSPPAPPRANASATSAPSAKPKRSDRSPMDVLDNPRLSLDKPTDDGFDPYNTGAFNRSASWDKIGRHRKR